VNPNYAAPVLFPRQRQRARLSPFGKRVIERGKPPEIIHILAYGKPNYAHQIPRDAWAEARAINSIEHIAALVLPAGDPPGRYQWPVRNSVCIVEHWPSRGMDQVASALAACLKRYGADYVIVRDAHFNCVRAVL